MHLFNALGNRNALLGPQTSHATSNGEIQRRYQLPSAARDRHNMSFNLALNLLNMTSKALFFSNLVVEFPISPWCASIKVSGLEKLDCIEVRSDAVGRYQVT